MLNPKWNYFFLVLLALFFGQCLDVKGMSLDSTSVSEGSSWKEEKKAIKARQKEEKKAKKKAKKDSIAEANDHYLMLAPFLVQSQFQDQRMTDIVFGAWGIGLDFNRYRYSNKSAADFSFKPLYAAGSTDVTSTAHFMRLDLKYGYHRRIKTVPYKFFVGGTAENLFGFKLYPALGNNTLAFENVVSLSPSFIWMNENLCDRGWFLVVKGGFSVGSFSVRYPRFTYNLAELQWHLPHSYTRVFGEIAWSPKLRYSEENRFYLSYGFEMASFSSDIDQAKTAYYINSLKLTYWLKTK